MRRFIASICMCGALLLIAASMIMNWTFWSGQGADATTGYVLGMVSIGIDIFKAVLPLVIAGCWAWRQRLGLSIAMVFFAGCLSFSFLSAIGFAAASRGAVVGGREANVLRYKAAEKDLADIEKKLANLMSIRPRAVIEEAIDRAKQDRRWTSSKECSDATAEASRTFCQSMGDLRIELASAIEVQGLRERELALKTEIDRLLAAGARLAKDPQAELLAGLSGLGLERVQNGLVLLLALLVELGAAFGLFLATLSRHPGPDGSPPNGGQDAPRPLPVGPQKRLSPPKRFVRAPDGSLMIE